MSFEKIVSAVKELYKQGKVPLAHLIFSKGDENIGILLPNFTPEQKNFIFHLAIPELVREFRPEKIYAVLYANLYIEGEKYDSVIILQTYPDGVDIIALYRDNDEVKELDLRQNRGYAPLFDTIIKTLRAIWDEVI